MYAYIDQIEKETKLISKNSHIIIKIKAYSMTLHISYILCQYE